MSYVIEADRLASMNLREGDIPGRYEIVIPETANMAADSVGRHAKSRPDHPALIFENAGLETRTWTFAELDSDAAGLAAALAALGVGRGDRVAIHTGLRPETGIAHLAVYNLGAIAVTLSQLYGPDTLAHILNHSGAGVIITQDSAWGRYRSDVDAFPGLRHRIVVGEAKGDELGFEDCLIGSGVDFRTAQTYADEPALLLYTSGSTGLPKGILHGHRILQAYMPSLSMAFNLDRDDPNSVFWSPADWAWVGGLLDMLLIAWAFGHTVATSEARFDAAWAFEFMARRKVTHTFLTPDGPEAHGPGQTAGGPGAARHLHRRRAAAGRRPQLGGRGSRRRLQRILRADRGEPPDRQLPCAVSSASGLHGARLSRSRDHRGG